MITKTYQIAVILGTYIISAWSLSFTFQQQVQDSIQDTVPVGKAVAKGVLPPPIVPPALSTLNAKEAAQKRKLDSLASVLDSAATIIQESSKSKGKTESLLDDTDKRHRNSLRLIGNLQPKRAKEVHTSPKPVQPVHYKVEKFTKPVPVADLVAPIEPAQSRKPNLLIRIKNKLFKRNIK
jgi:hypothetical protein